MNNYFLSGEGLVNFLGSLHKDHTVFLPVKRDTNRFFMKFDPALLAETGGEEIKEGFAIGEVRTSDPVKMFYTKPREKIAEDFQDTIPILEEKPFCIVGVKACDLKGFKIQDRVFGEDEYLDPFFMKKRKENIIIAADCTFAIDTCYCLALGVNPFPQDNFDLNLSEIGGGFVVEAGSDKGLGLIEQNSSLFVDVKDEQLSERDERRGSVVREVKNNIKKENIPNQDALQGAVEKNYNAPLWKEEAQTCVECGACNTVCPTCHCFLIYDQMDENRMTRLRVWDSCMINDFARVAGGANPRPELWMRLRNRFEKKFDFFPKISNIYACTGCGRCISACPAKIDIRKVLRRLVQNVPKQ